MLLQLCKGLLQDVEAGLVSQQVLVLPLHHPGVPDTAQVAHEGGQAQLLLRAQEGVEGAAVPGSASKSCIRIASEGS